MKLHQRPIGFVPNGVLMSRGFDVPNTGAFEPIHQALAILDQIHGDGLLPRLPIGFDSVLGNKAELQLNELNIPVVIRLGTQSQSYLLDVWHEIAHILDLLMLGNSGIFASDSRHPALADWWAAMARSRAYQDLLDLRDSRVILTQTGLKPVLRSQVHYLLEPRECFARSYQQYIAMSSGMALTQISLGVYDFQKPRQIVYSTQWSEDDFEPIALAFDRLLIAQGWVK
jgi:hypothetical protein